MRYHQLLGALIYVVVAITVYALFYAISDAHNRPSLDLETPKQRSARMSLLTSIAEIVALFIIYSHASLFGFVQYQTYALTLPSSFLDRLDYEREACGLVD